jgi:hypothetical protein
MGRELKRVPMDFAWPLNETWGGYLNPWRVNSIKCPSCDGSGYSPEEKRFKDQWYGYVPFDAAEYGATPLTVDHPGIVAFARRNAERSPEVYGSSQGAIAAEARRLFDLWRGMWMHNLIQSDVDALLEAGRLMDFTHVPRTEEQREICRAKVAAGGNSWLPEPNGYRPTAEEVNAWSILGMGHDSINSWVCIEARCKREGVPKSCPSCAGEGDMWTTPEAKAASEAWKRIEPPTGEGFQLWETTSEGSPISPVFASLYDLCEWAADNATTFGKEKATAVHWREMLDAGFVCHAEGNNVFT